jgi:hypothetical protein
MAFAGHFAALRSVHDNLIAIRSTMENQPGLGQPPPKVGPRKDASGPAIDWFWVKLGIKGGLAAVIAVVLLEWINPPGPGTIPFLAWLLSFQGVVYLRAGGTGDQRNIQNGVLAALALILLIVLLLLVTPLLASYTAMNLALFSVMFAFGFLTARISGINMWMLIALLTTSAFVSLNPQQPVPSQTIIDTFIGIIIGIGIGTTVARLIWPVLPQRVLRKSLLGLIARRRALLRGDALGANIQAELVMLSVEALQAAQQMRMPGCSAAEKARIITFVRTLLALGTQIRGIASHRDFLLEPARPLLRPKFERLDAGFIEVLDAFADCFRRGDTRREFPSLRDAVSDMSRAVQQIRDSRILAPLKLEVPLQMLDLANRYLMTANSLEECSELLRTLEIQRYWGDYAL